MTQRRLAGLIFAAGLFAQQAEATPWESINNKATIDVAILGHQYREYETYGLTPDGIADSERGGIPAGGFQLRWQGPLLLRALFQRSEGLTHYWGYMQQGTTLTPFNTLTGNTMLDVDLRAGIPLMASDHLQLVPYVGYGVHRWRRSLSQYVENLSHQDASFGVLVQWKPADKWVLELDGSMGRIFNPRMVSTDRGFDAALGKDGSIDRLGVTIDYKITDRVSVGGGWSGTQYKYGASGLVNASLIEPASKTRQSLRAVQLSYHY